MIKYLLLLIITLSACQARVFTPDVDKEATCTAKCYEFLCTGNLVSNGEVSILSKCNNQYIVGKFWGNTPEDYLVCECSERHEVVTTSGKTNSVFKRKFVVVRKPDVESK